LQTVVCNSVSVVRHVYPKAKDYQGEIGSKCEGEQEGGCTKVLCSPS